MRFASYSWKLLIPVAVLAVTVSGDVLPKSHIRVVDVASKKVTVEFMLPVEFELNQVSGPDVMKGDVLACKAKSETKDTMADGTKLTVIALECDTHEFVIQKVLFSRE